MNKKNNRKGFTIVELVIVIAVIAILATVLVPTFGDVIAKAQNTAAIQEAKTMHTNYVANVDYADGDVAEEDLIIKTEKGKYVAVVDSALTDTAYDTVAELIAAVTGVTFTETTGDPAVTTTYYWLVDASAVEAGEATKTPVTE